MDATGSHERPLHVQPIPKVRSVYREETSNWHTPIAELRVGRHEKLVKRKKLTRFGVYSIRLGATVLELFAFVGASYGPVSGRFRRWLYQRTLRESRSRRRLSWQQYALRVGSTTMADISKEELRKEITGKWRYRVM